MSDFFLSSVTRSLDWWFSGLEGKVDGTFLCHRADFELSKVEGRMKSHDT